MDLATLLGLATAWGLIIATIALGAAAGTFVNVPSLMIVIGGTFAVVLMRFTLGQFIGSIKTAMKAFCINLTRLKKLSSKWWNLPLSHVKKGYLL